MIRVLASIKKDGLPDTRQVRSSVVASMSAGKVEKVWWTITTVTLR